MTSGFRSFPWGKKAAATIREEGRASPLEHAGPKPSWAPGEKPLPPPLKRFFHGDRTFLIQAQVGRALTDEMFERGMTVKRFAEVLGTTQRHGQQMVSDGKIKMTMLARLCLVFGWKLEIRDALNRSILIFPPDNEVPARRNVPPLPGGPVDAPSAV